ncbi:MAG: cadherin-like beta sandwich domain-containing protein, partial [Spirochaetota bacterium]
METRHYLLAWNLAAKAGFKPEAIMFGDTLKVLALGSLELKELRVTTAEGKPLEPIATDEGGTKGFHVSLPYSLNSIKLEATPVDAAASVSYGSGESVAIGIGRSETSFRISTPTAGGTASRNFSIVTERADVALSGLEIDMGRLEPAFDPERRNYDVSLPYPVTEVVLRPRVAAADMEVGAVATLAPGNPATMAVGTNVLTVILRNDAGDVKEYTVTVSREAGSVVSTLRSLDIRDASGRKLALEPAFESGVSDYSLNLPYACDELDLSAEADDPRASVTNQSGGKADLAVGSNEFVVRTTAEDGVSSTEYRLRVERAEPRLSSLVLGEAVLEPAFDPDRRSYLVHLPYGSGSLAIGPVVDPVDAACGASLAPGWAPPGPFGVGESTVNIHLVDRTTSAGAYRITVLREPARAEATLRSLAATGDRGESLDLLPPFAMSVLDYRIEVPFAVRGVTLTGEATDEASAIGALPELAGQLRVGENAGSLRVTAEDGVTFTDYRVTVTRGEPRLEGLGLSEGALDPDFSPDTRSYRVYLPYAAGSLELDPAIAACDAEAGAGLAASVGEAARLAVGDTELRVRLVDGEEQVSCYELLVVRAAASTDSSFLGLAIFDQGGKQLEMSPAFASELGAGRIGVPYSVTGVSINATAAEGASLPTAADGAREIGMGENPLELTVTAEDGTTRSSYRVLVDRALPLLASLSTNRGQLVPAFDPAIRSYRVTVPRKTADITIGGALAEEDSAAGARLDPQPLQGMDLAPGENVVTMRIIDDAGLSVPYEVVVFRDMGTRDREDWIAPTFEPFLRSGYSAYIGGSGYTVESGVTLGLRGLDLPEPLRHLEAGAAYHLNRASGNFVDVSCTGGYAALGYHAVLSDFLPGLPWFLDPRLTPQLRLGATYLEILYTSGLFYKGPALYLAPGLGADLAFPGLPSLRIGLDLGYAMYFGGLSVQHLSTGLNTSWKL